MLRFIIDRIRAEYASQAVKTPMSAVKIKAAFAPQRPCPRPCLHSTGARSARDRPCSLPLARMSLGLYLPARLYTRYYLDTSLYLSVPRNLYIALYINISLCVSLCLSVPLCLCVSLILFFSHSLYFSVSVYLCNCLSRCHPSFFLFTLSLSTSISVSVYS